MKNHSEFDNFVSQYNKILANQVKFFDNNSNYFAEYKILEVARNLQIKPKTILDFGCGIGRSFEFLKIIYPESQLYGLDSSEESLKYAKSKYPFVQILKSEIVHNYNHSFDFVFVSNVFHHINPSEYNNQLALIHRLLKTNGDLIVFEHNEYNPVTNYLVRSCPFDKSANLIKKNKMVKIIKEAGFCVKKASYSLFFPGKLKILRPIEKYLGKIPLGGQYYVYAKKV
jgi:ubiquinone/menaquinone biosynthesis C-methylase UbiE